MFGLMEQDRNLGWKNLHTEEIRSFTLHNILLGLLNQGNNMSEKCTTQWREENT